MVYSNRMNDDCFKDFDAHVCSLLATPMLKAGMSAKAADVSMRAVGMGADVTREELRILRKLGADMKAQVETRFGRCGLGYVLARAGRAAELEYVLDHGADLTSRDRKGKYGL